MPSNSTKKILRVVQELESREPRLNLALEEAIARKVERGSVPPTLRFWCNEPSVIIGRSQSLRTEVDLPRCKEAGMPVIRRASGGGTVIHDLNNLNYSIYLPNPTCSSVVGEQLQWSESLSEVLADLGLRAKLESNGLFVAGEKVSGTAQTRRWGMLHHGTLLLSENELFHRMDHFLKAGRRNYDRDGEGSNGVTSKPARVNYLKVLSGKTINISHLIDRWVKQVAYRLNARPEKGHLSSSEIALAKRLRDFKYGTQKWTVDPRSIENST